MTALPAGLTERERELGAIIGAYNEVTEQLKGAHDRLGSEVRRLREELARKNAELRRRERLAALGEMAAGVAHEIRNPLSGIRLFASLLVKDLVDRPAEQRLARRIDTCVCSLEAIVADILEFGRPSAANYMPVDLPELIAETIELAGTKLKDADVRMQMPDAGIELVTDPSLLQRALLNLLKNAIEAAASSGSDRMRPEVRIMASRPWRGYIAIAVEDNGPGISAEIRDRIFNPFFTTRDEGVGLGLAIVHQIAEVLGGRVRAGNRRAGGAVFTLRLPLSPANAGEKTSIRTEPGDLSDPKSGPSIGGSEAEPDGWGLDDQGEQEHHPGGGHREPFGLDSSGPKPTLRCAKDRTPGGTCEKPESEESGESDGFILATSKEAC
jgi:signal transduction histidine kinase